MKIKGAGSFHHAIRKIARYMDLPEELELTVWFLDNKFDGRAGFSSKTGEYFIVIPEAVLWQDCMALDSLVHELRHIRQFIEGHLKLGHPTGTKWMGEFYDWYIPHQLCPWEEDAIMYAHYNIEDIADLLGWCKTA